jgi:hypothetical protein
MSAHWKWAIVLGTVALVVLPLWAIARVRANSSRESGVAARPGIPAEALAPARTARDRIEDSERRMVEEDQALAQALARMEGGRFVPAEQKATIEALRTFVKGLRGIAADLLSHHLAFVSVQEEYRHALAAAPSKFRDANRLFLEYAAEELFYEIKQDYERLAQDWLTLSTLVERRAAEVERDDRTRDWGDTLRYVERTALFLERLDAHLESFPVNLDSGEIRERHLADLKAYVDGFEALRRHLNTYREKLRNGAVSPAVREELTTTLRLQTASTYPVAFVPNAPPPRVVTPELPPLPPGSYLCFNFDRERMELGVSVTQEFKVGERFRLDVDGQEYATVVVLRNVGRTSLGFIIEIDSTKPFPYMPRKLVLVRLPSSDPSDSTTLASRR